MPGHHHRSSNLKQLNKKNKRSKSSKRSLNRAAGGKINARGKSGQKAAFAQSKADRRNKLQQKRDTKRADLLRRKRGISGSAIPRVVGIVSLGTASAIEAQLREAILEGADKTQRSLNDATVSAKFDTHKKDGSLTVLTNAGAFQKHYQETCNDTEAAVQSALDLCRVCDMVVFVVDANASKCDQDILDMQIGADDNASTKTARSQRETWDHLIGEQGDAILQAVKAQGLPSMMTVLAHTVSEEREAADFMSVKSAKSVMRAHTKRSLALKKYTSRFANTEFGPDNDTVMEVDISRFTPKNEDGLDEDDEEEEAKETANKRDMDALVRALCTKAALPPKWVSNSPRPFVLSDSHQYDESNRELKLTGYVRGIVPFSVNSLVHVPNLGTYACASIEKCKHPFSHKNSDSVQADARLVADPSEREALDMFATPDALDGEQNLVGFEEEDEGMAGDGEDANEQQFSRPAGWGDYQSAWLDAVDDVGGEETGFDHGELAAELNKKSSASVAGDTMDLDDANEVNAEAKRRLQEERRKEQAEHQDFPDEVDVDEDENARDRFARYRSLKSFKKTYWDPKENLPDSYSTVFHFSSFKGTQRSVMQDMKDIVEAAEAQEGQYGFTPATTKGDDVQMSNMEEEDEEDEDLLKGCVPSGSYVTLTLQGVTPEAMERVSLQSLLVAVALLPHENKVSVLHAGLSQCGNDTEEHPIKSKDIVTFRCGWKTWRTRPIFSQNNLNCNKHKFERFMPGGGAFFAATFFGPVTYTPCPILAFRQREGHAMELCASGSMIGADADRIVVKRIILTGYPVRVHKRHATVKYMFYNPDDVKWFKPAELWTKHGLNGHIVESVGEHGTMKVLFNAPIKQHDTVCLPLYKRIYPKFVEEGSDSSGKSIRFGQPQLTVL